MSPQKVTSLFLKSSLQNGCKNAEICGLISFRRRLGKGSQMRSEPPLCGGLISLCAAELGIDGSVITKVVFTWHWARRRVKIAAGMTAIDVQHVVGTLPKACSEMNANVPTDVHVLHFLALGGPNKVNDVEILEFPADVVCEIDAMNREAARCTPMSGVTLQRPHSCQTQAVQIPVMGILVDWSVILKGFIPQSG